MLTIPDNALTVWSPEELAENLGISSRTLAAWRKARTGPAYIRSGVHIGRGDGLALNPPRHPHHQLRKTPMKEHQERKASPFTIAVLHLKNALKELIEESRLHASSHADTNSAE